MLRVKLRLSEGKRLDLFNNAANKSFERTRNNLAFYLLCRLRAGIDQRYALYKHVEGNFKNMTIFVATSKRFYPEAESIVESLKGSNITVYDPVNLP